MQYYISILQTSNLVMLSNSKKQTIFYIAPLYKYESCQVLKAQKQTILKITKIATWLRV